MHTTHPPPHTCRPFTTHIASTAPTSHSAAAPLFRSHNAVAAIDVGPEVAAVQFSVCNFMQLWQIRPRTFPSLKHIPCNWSREKDAHPACGRMSEIVYNCIKFIILRNLYIYLFHALHYGAAGEKPQGNQWRTRRWLSQIKDTLGSPLYPRIEGLSTLC